MGTTGDEEQDDAESVVEYLTEYIERVEAHVEEKVAPLLDDDSEGDSGSHLRRL